MSAYTEQITAELEAVIADHPDLEQLLRRSLSEAWYVGFRAGQDAESGEAHVDVVNDDPFRRTPGHWVGGIDGGRWPA